MERKFTLSTDSTCDLYASFIKENDIKFVSLTYTVEDRNGNMTDGLDNFTEYSQYVDFYAKLRNGCFSRTSMLNYESHLAHFTRLAEEGAKDVVHFTISSGLSPTVTVAEKAAADVKKKYPQFNVYAVDSLAATIGQGALVRAALRMRDEGKTAEETVTYVKDLRLKIQYMIAVNDLNYLKRAGRVSTTSAVFGGLLQVKPIIISDTDGQNVAVEKVKGRKNSLVRLADLFKETYRENPHQRVFVVHADCPDGAEELKKLVEERLPDKSVPIYTAGIGPIIGATVGPGTLAVYCYGKEVTFKNAK